MALERITAFFMHETEGNVAQAAMSNLVRTDSFVYGEIDVDGIPALESQGLIVQRHVTEVPSVRSRFPLEPASLDGRLESFSRLDESVAEEDDLSKPQIYLIRLAGPLMEGWRQAVAFLGIRLEAVGPQTYIAQLTLRQRVDLSALPFVIGVDRNAEAAPVPLETASLAPASDTTAVVTYDLRMRNEADADAVMAVLTAPGVVISGAKSRKIRFVTTEGAPILRTVARMPEVERLLQYVPPKLFNDRARVLLGMDGAAGVATFPYDGAGQIVAIADTGVDDQHPDLIDRFKNRSKDIVALGRTADHSDPAGHGTHVAGSIAGTGAASDGQIRGTAPGATLFFQSILDAGGHLGGLPLDINDLFDQAYEAGARIHNNSWGAGTQSAYTFSSQEADEFVDRNRDMVIVIAAGNEGTAANPVSSAPGYVDWLSLGSPATSKNALTVGASQTDRTAGGYAAMTWQKGWPSKFPMVPVATETTSGDPQKMAAFSSRGPCDDQRIKPDVVAPGTNIASTKSAVAPISHFWGPYPGFDDKYAYLGGTSMAAPIVSGCLAGIRQYYTGTRAHLPSAALLKATLINGTQRLTGDSAIAEFADLPNFHQGFGCVSMSDTLPNPAAPSRVLEFLDTWQDPNAHFTYTGQRARYLVSVAAGQELRFCLAYSDRPGRALQNNLNLFVQFMGSGRKWIGNDKLPRRITPLDSDNNVEIIRIPDPAPGDYMIQVAAANLLSTAGQDFALVITGNLSGGLSVVPGP